MIRWPMSFGASPFMRMQRTLAFAVLLTGCDAPLKPLQTDDIRLPQRGLTPSTAIRYLPYGAPIPQSANLDIFPEPYNEQRHGPPLPNSSPERNILSSLAGSLPPIRERKLSGNPFSSAAGSSSQSYSLQIVPSPTTQFFGISENHDAELGVTLPPTSGSTTRYLYTPTVLPPGGSCVEATTMHSRSPGGQTIHRQGWLNWCVPGGQWWVIENMDALFQQKYVRTMNGEAGLSLSLVTPNNGAGYGGCWYGLLYNFSVGGWEQKFGYCGTGTVYHGSGFGGITGWTAWEAWNIVSPGVCPTLPSSRAQGIQLHVSANSGVQYINDFAVGQSVNGPYCWTNFGGTPYTFEFPAEYLGMWRARTPAF